MNTRGYFFANKCLRVFSRLKLPKSFTWKLNKIIPSILFYPHMNKEEFKFFHRIAKYNKTVVEFGSGGSTIYFCNKKARLYTVESNPEFFRYMNSIPLIKRSLKRGLIFRYTDIGPTDQWGTPINNEHADNWPQYYTGIWENVLAKNDRPGLIFIDGRFRVCCCLYAIIKIAEMGLENTFIIIHDFWTRKEYHIVLNYLDIYEHTSNICAFRARQPVNTDEIRKLIPAYAGSLT